MAWSRTQAMNLTAYHLLLSIVNLLNLPLQDGVFYARRSGRLVVQSARVERLKMLKEDSAFSLALEAEEGEGEVGPVTQGYLTAVRGILYDVGFLLDQEPDLNRNEDFFADFARLETLVANSASVDDFEEVSDLAFKLSIMLPFWQDAEAVEERNRAARAYELDH